MDSMANAQETRKDRRQAARAAREEAERHQAAAATRKRRLYQLGGLVGLAAVVVVVAIVISYRRDEGPAAEGRRERRGPDAGGAGVRRHPPERGHAGRSEGAGHARRVRRSRVPGLQGLLGRRASPADPEVRAQRSAEDGVQAVPVRAAVLAPGRAVLVRRRAAEQGLGLRSRLVHQPGRRGRQLRHGRVRAPDRERRPRARRRTSSSRIPRRRRPKTPRRRWRRSSRSSASTTTPSFTGGKTGGTMTPVDLSQNPDKAISDLVAAAGGTT